MSFRQKNGENLYQAWERFKGLLRDCPHHHQMSEVLAHTFIENLDAQHKSSLDTAAEGQARKGQGNNNQYRNSYNPKWRNHPNFRWSDNQGNQKLNYEPAHVPEAPMNSMEKMMKTMMSDIQKMMIDQQKLIADNKNPDLEVQNLERQMEQIAGAQNTRPPGGLPSDTDVNPKPCNAVTFRNGRELEEVAPKKTSQVEAKKEKIVKEMIEKERVVEIPVANQPQPVVAKPPPPFPQHLARQKEEATYKKFLDLLKQVVTRALCDLGESINLMPSSIFRKVGLRVPRPTTIVLQLADRSLARPEGIIEDVLVQVGSLIIPANLMILDFEPDPEVPFILGRPFLATARALIDVAAG
ncbi:uncharacterized protein LOC132610532 [Lycium barbarum]|uniref:uncharacterized protein LOC132610532 n=1 Tax=Lycium barbarum TaxID=112863 RepID=UPI00293F58F3|nr:uncharacterized protein LOC132610532 [Lycium barbarum]